MYQLSKGYHTKFSTHIRYTIHLNHVSAECFQPWFSRCLIFWNSYVSTSSYRCRVISGIWEFHIFQFHFCFSFYSHSHSQHLCCIIKHISCRFHFIKRPFQDQLSSSPKSCSLSSALLRNLIEWIRGHSWKKENVGNKLKQERKWGNISQLSSEFKK